MSRTNCNTLFYDKQKSCFVIGRNGVTAPCTCDVVMSPTEVLYLWNRGDVNEYASVLSKELSKIVLPTSAQGVMVHVSIIALI